MDDDPCTEKNEPLWDPDGETESERLKREHDKMRNEEQAKADLARLLSGLPERTRDILKYLFGVEEERPHSLQETGSRFGISRQRVHQIREDAFTKVRKSGGDLQVKCGGS